MAKVRGLRDGAQVKGSVKGIGKCLKEEVQGRGSGKGLRERSIHTKRINYHIYLMAYHPVGSSVL